MSAPEPVQTETILVVDDQPDFSAGLARLLRRGFPDRTVLVAAGGVQALDILGKVPVAVMISDLRMPGLSGQALLEQALALEPALTAVMLTAYGTVETAVQALKAGAYDFLTKPIDPDALYRSVGKCLERSRLLRENLQLRDLAARDGLRSRLIGESQAMRRLKDTIAAVAAADYTVLVRGESGTGKELVARTIHGLSRRSAARMVSVNCPAIPDQLLESELFGHVKGAFTGADRARKGLFLNAHRSTLFLDEIGDISPAVQTKLLRVIQEGEIRPVGTSEQIRVDVRILASTNQPLEDKLKDRSFREDLFYRLNVLTIHVPPLRERCEDVPLLASAFLHQTCLEMNAPAKDISPEALAYLSGRSWPGNVRELQNFVRRLTVFCPGERIDIPLVRLVEGQCAGPAGPDPGPAGGLGTYREAKHHLLDDFTRRYVRSLLAQTGGNISEAARVSGLERVSLQKILKRLSIEAGEFKSA
jgi:DNA-binding NtrC family response regulator